MNVLMLVEELACSGAVSFSNCSNRTVQRWAKRVNEYLEANKYEWRVVTKDNSIIVEGEIE